MKKLPTLFVCVLIGSTVLNAQTNRSNTKKTIPYKANYQRMTVGGDHILKIRDGTSWSWENNDFEYVNNKLYIYN